RANLWAMRELGVRRLIGPCASGSLQKDLPPGTFVVCNQFIDRTSARKDSFFDGPVTTHVSAADPYCPDLRQVLPDTGRSQRREGVHREQRQAAEAPVRGDPEDRGAAVRRVRERARGRALLAWGNPWFASAAQRAAGPRKASQMPTVQGSESRIHYVQHGEGPD